VTATPQELVERFYHEVWNKADEEVAREILHADFRFRGSLGPEHRGPEGFIGYMRSVHAALAGYICEIMDLVTTEDRAVARMRFAGRHQRPFFGVEATGMNIEWSGAAFFTCRHGKITALWVLGDIDAVKRQLGSDANRDFEAGSDRRG